MSNDEHSTPHGLRSYPWLLSYRTSATLIEGRPVDILHDFYVPALNRSVRYDRVAGYFRSSSLAVASQGFSAFVGHHGRMRLIVGADLASDDVAAILAGDSQRLAARLNGELEQASAWPEDVCNGMQLLAWMIAHDYLDIRVAFRVHGLTGEPLSFEAVDDGYVHEKWFVMQDEHGDRLYGSGSLNESKTALFFNAENIDIHCDWLGETDRLRVDEAAAAFDNLWQGQVPHMPVLTLPEAVRQRLVQLAEGIGRPLEIDGTSAAPREVAPPSMLERLQFAVLRDAPFMPNGRYVGLETAPVEPWPHQEVVARRLIEAWPYSYLLCDEVGLGKTIEAGLAFRSLYLSGIARRILIAVPASLVPQWHRQMASKLLLPFGRAVASPEIMHEYLLPFKQTHKSSSLYDPDLVIISTGLLARRERAQGLQTAEKFDIGLVDEAHNARRSNPNGSFSAHPEFVHLYTSIRDYLQPAVRSLWLATATPMQIHPVEVCDLMALINRVGSYQFDPSLTWQYYEILGKMIHNETLSEQEWALLRHTLQLLETQDPLLWNFIEQNVIDGRTRITFNQWLQRGITPRGRDVVLLCRLIFTASPLGRVMLRHNRKLLEIYRERGQLQQNIARRNVYLPPVINFTPLEKHIYDQLREYCDSLDRQMRASGNHLSFYTIRLLLSFLQLRFASSLYALRETLRRRLAKVDATLQYQQQAAAKDVEWERDALQESVFEGEEEDDQIAVESLLKNRTVADLKWERVRLHQMIEDMADLTGPSSKMQVLLEQLDRRRDGMTGRIRQTIIFTRFYDTLTDIIGHLRYKDSRLLVGSYSGQGGECVQQRTGRMLRLDLEEVKERFLRGDIDVLVCTDAAAEGLNLQTADMLINYDLGWNPMKVEQRIGRIDRIGQRHDVIHVLNLCYTDSAEEIVYGRLLSRLEKANLIVGAQQISLLPVQPLEFQQLANGTLSEQELEEAVRKRLKEQSQYAERMEFSPQDLYEMYMRLSEHVKSAPVNLAAIQACLGRSQYLQELGCSVAGEAGRELLVLEGLTAISSGALLTISRELYEEGLGEDQPRVHFASYGEPYFDAVLEHMEQFELPPCIRRLTATVEELAGVNLVGYAVACIAEEGTVAVRMITSWHHLDGLVLAEDYSLTDADVAPLQEELHRLAGQEFNAYRTASRIERYNLRAARAQEMINFYVIRNLLNERAPQGDDALFGPTLRDVETLLNDRPELFINDLPADRIRLLVNDLLFDCQVPGVGECAVIEAPALLVSTAIDAASRLADSLKIKKTRLLLDNVMSRLRREIDECWKKVQKL